MANLGVSSKALFFLGLAFIVVGAGIANIPRGEVAIYAPALIQTITTYPYTRAGTVMILVGALLLLIAYVILLQINLGLAQKEVPEEKQSPQIKARTWK